MVLIAPKIGCSAHLNSFVRNRSITATSFLRSSENSTGAVPPIPCSISGRVGTPGGQRRGARNAIHLIKYLKSFGYDEIAINVHYLADAITRTLGDGSAFGVRLEYLHEATLMGSAGALKPMEHFFGNDTFVVVGCDDLTDLPLDRVAAMHAAATK